MILVDTNVLLRAADPGHSDRNAAVNAVVQLTATPGEHLIIAPQVLFEAYVVYTRPIEANGFGYAPDRALSELLATREVFELLPDTGRLYETCAKLVSRYSIRGKQAHDARLVASMLEHGMGRLLTFNHRDFSRYQEIEAVSPHNAPSGP